MNARIILFLVFLGFVCCAPGVLPIISTKLFNGDVTCVWTGDPTRFYEVLVTKDNVTDGWYQVRGVQYVVEDVLLYDSISINVRSLDDGTKTTLTYKVRKKESKIGQFVNISLTDPLFARVSPYNIYHMNKLNRGIIRVTSSGITLKQSKYTHISRPYESTNITFRIGDITLKDAGYYNGGTYANSAWSGGGCILIVLNKPLKPIITGNLDISVGSSSELTCSSSPSSTPDYYARLVSLSYTWFLNNRKMAGETGKVLRISVTKDLKYKQLSCTAMDKLESDLSDPVFINPECKICNHHLNKTDKEEKYNVITVRSQRTELLKLQSHLTISLPHEIGKITNRDQSCKKKKHKEYENWR